MLSTACSAFSGLLSLATGGNNMFTAEVFFVNRRDFIDQKWGTPEPIALRDPDLGLARLRAFGAYSMAVTDPQLFVTKIVGTMGLFQTSQIQNYLRTIIISKLTDALGESKKGLFDLPAMFNEISAAVRAKVTDDFALLGIGIHSSSSATARVMASPCCRNWRPAMGCVRNALLEAQHVEHVEQAGLLVRQEPHRAQAALGVGGAAGRLV